MATGNRPTHHLNIVVGEGQAARFTRICGLWPTKEGHGFTGEIPAGITISGRLVILEAKDRDDQA